MSGDNFTIPGTTPSQAAVNRAYFMTPWHYPPPSNTLAEQTMRAAIDAAVEQADLSAALQAKWLEFVGSGRVGPIEEFCDEFAAAVKEALLR